MAVSTAVAVAALAVAGLGRGRQRGVPQETASAEVSASEVSVKLTGVARSALWSAAAVVALTGWLAGRVARLEPLVLTGACATVAALALEAPVAALARRGLPRAKAALVLLLAAAASLAGLAAATASMLATQSRALAGQLPEVAREVASAAEHWFAIQVEPGKVETFLRSENGPLGWALQWASQLSWPLLSALGYLLTGGFLTFYLLVDGPALRSEVVSRVPVAAADRLGHGFELAVARAGGWLRVRMLLTAATAAAAYVLLAVVGVESALFLALWCALVAQLVPVAGTYLAAALPTAAALLVSPTAAAVFVVGFVVYQQVENLWLAPRVSRWALRLHPAVGLLAVLAAARMFGPVAAVVAAPVAATVVAFVSAYLPPGWPWRR